MINRRFIFWGLFAAFFWIVLSRLFQIETLLKALARGQVIWICTAALLQVGFYTAFTAIYQGAFHTVGLRKPPLLHLLPLTFAAVFVNVVAPSGGVAGGALFVDDAARRGESPAKAAAGVVVKTLSDFVAISLVLAAGLGYLLWRGHLQTYQMMGAVVFVTILLGLSGSLALGLWKPSALQKALAGAQALIDRISVRIRRRRALSPGWAERSAKELAQASKNVVSHPGRGGRTLLFSLSAHAFNISSLYAIFRAFHTEVPPGALIAGYAIALLFLIVSITPMGIGVMEGAMVLAFQSLGIPLAVATIVALAFRGIGFWIPLLIGFVVLRHTSSFSRQSQDPSDEARE